MEPFKHVENGEQDWIFNCEWVFSSCVMGLQWLRYLRHFYFMQLCSVLRVFARVVLSVFASSCWFLVSFYFSLFVRGFAYLSSRSLSIEGEKNHLLPKACGTFSPKDKTVRLSFEYLLGPINGRQPE